MSSFALRQSDFHKILQSGNTRYVIYAINLLLVVWIASQLATLTWGLLKSPESASPPMATPRNIPAKVDPDRQLIGQLPGWHLMGEAQKNTAPVTTSVPADAPDTHLRLTLRGALASDDPVNARAIIADPKGKDEQYSIGDALPGNAELSEIYPDRVILKRSGRYETLRLPQDTRRPPRGAAARATPARQASTSQGTARQLAAVREQIRKNPAAVSRMLRAKPKKDASGNMLGYELAPGSNAKMFGELGLKNGDVAIQVNDLELSNPANAGKALNALQSGKPVVLRLLRDGVEQTLSMDGL